MHRFDGECDLRKDKDDAAVTGVAAESDGLAEADSVDSTGSVHSDVVGGPDLAIGQDTNGLSSPFNARGYEYIGQDIAHMPLAPEGDFDVCEAMGEPLGPWFVVTHEGPGRTPLRTEGELINGLDDHVIVIRHIGDGGHILRSIIPWTQIVMIQGREEELTRWADEEDEGSPDVGIQDELPFRRPKADK